MTEAAPPEKTQTVTIETVGHRGDGIAHIGTTQIYVPYTLPGETVRLHADGNRGNAEEVLTPSPERIAPVCPHFGQCGGCALQHWKASSYAHWKENQITEALAARGLSCEIAPIKISPPGVRRRASFGARRRKSGMLFGFQARASHEIIPLTQCPILHPALVQAIPALTKLIAPLLTRRTTAHIQTTFTDSGLDVAITDVRDPDAQAGQALGVVAKSANIARLSINGEIITQSEPPTIHFDGIAVRPPPGAFLQTSEWADQAMLEHLRTALGGTRRAADLFAGCGTFALPLAQSMSIYAADSDAPMMAALQAAAHGHPGLKPVRTDARDLFKRPLIPAELKPFDAVIFDPPRAGASAQAEQLALSKVPKVIAISCNPATFARDARTLVDGGYRLTTIWPIDQFLYSAHIELLAAFEREK